MSGTVFKPKVAAVVLAAGASRRMTAIKQLLPWENSTLLEHVIGQLRKAGAAHIFVVLGAHEKEIMSQIDSTNLNFIQNNNWSNGMGTSIAKTIPALQDFYLEFDGVLIAACDQPLISVDHYKKLINSCINRDRIIASSYGSGVGIPVVFDNSYFMKLSGLHKDVGAKSIINQHLQHLITLDAPEGLIDLDTIESYEKYYQTYGKDI